MEPKIDIPKPDITNVPDSKPDALIVAALMGNSIAKFKAKNRLKTQLSAPANSSPVFLPDTPANSASLASRFSIKSKSFNSGKKNEMEENPVSFNDVKLESQDNLSNSNHFNNSAKKHLNASNLSRQKFSSKASKCMLFKFLFIKKVFNFRNFI